MCLNEKKSSKLSNLLTLFSFHMTGSVTLYDSFTWGGICDFQYNIYFFHSNCSHTHTHKIFSTHIQTTL